MARKKKRKVRAYTEVGKRIAAVGKRQRLIAGVLGVSQQTVSKKLRGETAIMLTDLEALAKHYKVPAAYFVETEAVPAEFAAALARIRKKGGPLQDLVVLLSGLTATEVRRILEIAQVIAKSGASAKIPSRSRAAEPAAPYGKK